MSGKTSPKFGAEIEFRAAIFSRPAPSLDARVRIVSVRTEDGKIVVEAVRDTMGPMA